MRSRVCAAITGGLPRRGKAPDSHVPYFGNRALARGPPRRPRAFEGRGEDERSVGLLDEPMTGMLAPSASMPGRIPTSDSYLAGSPRMHVTEKGQVTIPKRIRTAAGIAPGSEVAFSLEGSRIVITPVASHVRDDRRTALRKAAARARASMAPEFRHLGADEIMAFLRGDAPAPATKPARRGRR
jgi:AbrB family looped-hinge helix DNA binding protein